MKQLRFPYFVYLDSLYKIAVTNKAFLLGLASSALKGNKTAACLYSAAIKVWESGDRLLEMLEEPSDHRERLFAFRKLDQSWRKQLRLPF